MQSVPGFETFDDAYVACLRGVYESYDYVNAPRGLPSRERLNVSFLLKTPRERVPYLASRKTNIVFNFAHALWTLSGRDDLETIAYYAPTFQRFSPDGRTLTGSAYGPRDLSAEGPRPTVAVEPHHGRSRTGPRFSDPAQADPVSIRGRFGIDSFARARQEGRLADSVIHSSDSSEDVEREFDIWFGAEHLGLVRAETGIGTGQNPWKP